MEDLKNLQFDYSKLKGKITEKFRTQREFAKALGISDARLSGKLNNKAMFSQKEIFKAINLLGEDTSDLFFLQIFNGKP